MGALACVMYAYLRVRHTRLHTGVCPSRGETHISVWALCPSQGETHVSPYGRVPVTGALVRVTLAWVLGLTHVPLLLSLNYGSNYKFMKETRQRKQTFIKI